MIVISKKISGQNVPARNSSEIRCLPCGELYTLFLAEENGIQEEKIRDRLEEITVVWVPEHGTGILDRAATYTPETNTLLIN